MENQNQDDLATRRTYRDTKLQIMCAHDLVSQKRWFLVV